MKERPILFSSSMVRAILDGSKTMTRRIIKPQPTHFNPAGTPRRVVPNGGPSESICCPYGQPGDRLWVRETWAAPHALDGHTPRFMPPTTRVHYAASEDRGGLLWRASIHMPRWASRILLEIADVRIERLQDISEDDAQAEGLEYSERFEGYCIGEAEHYNSHDPRLSYASLWESINGPDSWAANPWVWVVTFRRVEP